MIADKLAHRIGERIGRRKLLTRIGAASMGAAVAVIGLPSRAEAATVRVKCCTLCYSPANTCCAGRPPYCVWAWTCCEAGKRYRCSEFYCGSGGPEPQCDASCSGVNCSKITEIGGC